MRRPCQHPTFPHLGSILWSSICGEIAPSQRSGGEEGCIIPFIILLQFFAILDICACIFCMSCVFM